MRVPPRFARYVVSAHGSVSTEQIFNRAREHVMDARLSVRSGWTFEEHKRGLPFSLLESPLEEFFIFPAGQHFLLEVVGRTVRREQAETSILESASRFPLPASRIRDGADCGHSLVGPEEFEPAPLSVLATTCESDASTSDS